MATPDTDSDKPKRRPFREQWRTARQAFPEVVALTRPFHGMLLAGLVLVFINRGAGLVLPLTVRMLFDEGIKNSNLPLIHRIAAAVIGAGVVQGVTAYFLTQTLSMAAQRLIRDLRERLMAHVVHLPLRYFDNKKSGELVSRVMYDVDGLKNLVGTGMVELLSGSLTAIAASACLMYLNWLLTSIILLFVAVFGALMIYSFKVLRPLFRARSKIMEETTGRLAEAFGGIRVIKSYHTEPREEETFSANVGTLLAKILATINTFSRLGLISGVLVALVSATIMVVGARQIVDGRMTLGELFQYITFVALLIGPVIQITRFGSELSESFAGIDRMKEVLSEPREDAGDAARRAAPRIDGEVQFRDVVFGYDPARPVIHGISFTSKPGTATALVGPSGAGKSTVISLLAKFHAPQSGSILVDGIDLDDLRTGDFRSQLGAVLQDSFLFSGSVRENLLYAKPGASDGDIRDAARLAHCLEFVEVLPQGFDTVIGERGIKLSGGQRQRLAIARAILAQPRILILDEATSSLDSESEALIQEGLAHLMQGRTTFVIAHRLSTIRRADQILVLDAGCISERGTHDELLALGGRYAAMYNRQHGMMQNIFVNPGEDPTARAAALATRAAAPTPARGAARV